MSRARGERSPSPSAVARAVRRALRRRNGATASGSPDPSTGRRRQQPGPATKDGQGTSSILAPRREYPGTLPYNGLAAYLQGDRTPEQVKRENLDLVMSALQARDIPAFVVRTGSLTRHTVGVFEEHREAALEALVEAHGNTPVYVRTPMRGGGSGPTEMRDLPGDPSLSAEDVLRICRVYVAENRHFALDFDYACDLEFWRRDSKRSAVRIAPRTNVAADVVAESDLGPAEVELGGRRYPTASVFTRRMVEDIVFPIDVVYAWVDGDDPVWQEKKEQVKAQLEGRAADFHPRSVAPGRFRSRDEIRYSLRSLQMFAPWVRNVYIVTDDQVPAWLDTSAPGLRVVNHRELFKGAVLPTFNSHVISSYLHHIEGLSEHFLYLNDDVLFGRPVGPQHFFTPAGQARVFPSTTRRPFGEASADHALQVHVAHNIRRVLEREYGVTISRAVQHTPVALLRSELARLEEMFAEEFATTRRNQFRSEADIAAGLLFHYYSQIVGVGVASKIDYKYVNVGDSRQEAGLRTLLRRRHKDVFCLNDSVVPNQTPSSDAVVREFLENYFPVRSTFERPGR
jgi:hypothetical protein